MSQTFEQFSNSDRTSDNSSHPQLNRSIDFRDFQNFPTSENTASVDGNHLTFAPPDYGSFATGTGANDSSGSLPSTANSDRGSFATTASGQGPDSGSEHGYDHHSHREHQHHRGGAGELRQLQREDAQLSQELSTLEQQLATLTGENTGTTASSVSGADTGGSPASNAGGDSSATTNPTTSSTGESAVTNPTTSSTGDSATTNPTTSSTGDSATTNPTTSPTGESATTTPTTSPTGESAITNPTTSSTGDSATTNPTTSSSGASTNPITNPATDGGSSTSAAGTTNGDGGTSTTPTDTGSLQSGVIIGTNDGSGWGKSAAQTILNGGITWDRIELGNPYNDTPAVSAADGFNVDAILGDSGAVSPQNIVSDFQQNPQIKLAEFVNEPYLNAYKGNPVAYAQAYLAAVQAKDAAGISTPLLFGMIGDYQRPDGTWSQDQAGGGWLADAVNGLGGPNSQQGQELIQAILQNGVSEHPYGAPGAGSDSSGGSNEVVAFENEMQKVLGGVAPEYLTEFGFSIGTGDSGANVTSASQQAADAQADYNQWLADPNVKGIFWYQSHNDSTGNWGYMDSSGNTNATFNVISTAAKEEGQ